MKPCQTCGSPLENGEKQCSHCDADQNEMSVKPFKGDHVAAPEPLSKGEKQFESLMTFYMMFVPWVLGGLGYFFWGDTGAIVGIIFGFLPWVAGSLSG